MTAKPVDVVVAPSTKAEPHRFVLLVLSAALIVRLATVIAFSVEPTSDAASYHRLGQALSEGRGFSTSAGMPETFRPPLYPVLIGAVYMVTGPRPAAVRVLQALIDVGTCALIWWWTRRRVGETYARVALVIAAGSMSAIASVRLLLSECFAAFLLTATMVLFDVALEHPERNRSFLMSGFLAGLLTLTRSVMVVFPILLLVRVWVRRPPLRRTVAASALICLGYVTPVGFWMVRNVIVVGAPVLTTQGGIGLYSSHFRAPGQPYGNLTEDETTRQADLLTPVDGDRFLTRATVERLRQSPGQFFKPIPVKLFYLLIPFDWEVIGNRVFNGTYFLTMLFVVAAVPILIRHNASLLVPCLMPLGYFVVIAMFLYGSPRFRLPAEPMLAPVAAYGVLVVMTRVRARITSRSQSMARPNLQV